MIEVTPDPAQTMQIVVKSPPQQEFVGITFRQTHNPHVVNRHAGYIVKASFHHLFRQDDGAMIFVMRPHFLRNYSRTDDPL